MSRNQYTGFLQKVDSHGFDHTKCWEWLGAGKGNGYGNVNVGRKNKPAHRLSYELFVGEVPENLDVCHTCDVRYCVNPDHLFLGTRKQNMLDAVRKKRTAGGGRKHLREVEVQEIKRLLNLGTPTFKIIAATGIGRSTISDIKRGRSYV